MNKTLILVVEDDRPIRNLIVTTLKTHDYKYLAAENGSSAILEASSHNPDIVLLDLGLPDMEGVEVIKKIRTWSNMPIIVISARSEDTDKIEALDAGADDYITKPFRINELLSRMRSVQRRYHRQEEDIIQIQYLSIYPKQGKVYKEQEEILLTALEYRLLMVLVNHPQQVLSRSQLLEGIWDVAGDFVNDNTLSVYMKRLREKLERDPKNPTIIVTVRGLGYRLELHHAA